MWGFESLEWVNAHPCLVQLIVSSHCHVITADFPHVFDDMVRFGIKICLKASATNGPMNPLDGQTSFSIDNEAVSVEITLA